MLSQSIKREQYIPESHALILVTYIIQVSNHNYINNGIK